MKNLIFTVSLSFALFAPTSRATAGKFCVDKLTHNSGIGTSTSAPTDLVQLDARSAESVQEYARKIPAYVGQTINIELIYPTGESHMIRQAVDREENLVTELRSAAVQLKLGEPVSQFSGEEIILAFKYLNSRGRSGTHISQILSINEIDMQTLSLGRNRNISQIVLDELGKFLSGVPKQVQLSILTRSTGVIPVDMRMTRLAHQITGTLRSALAYSQVNVELFAIPDRGEGLVYRYTSAVNANLLSSKATSLLEPTYMALLDTDRKVNRPFEELDRELMQSYLSSLIAQPEDSSILFSGVGDGTLFSTAQKYHLDNGYANRPVYGTTYIPPEKLVVPDSPTLFTGKLLEHLSENEIQSLKGKVGIVVDQWGDLAHTQFLNETLNRMSLILNAGGKILFYIGPEEWRYTSGLAKVKTKTSIYSDIVRLPDGKDITLVEYLKLNLKGFHIKVGSSTMELIRDAKPYHLPKLRFLSYDPTASRALSRVFAVVNDVPSIRVSGTNTLQ